MSGYAQVSTFPLFFYTVNTLADFLKVSEKDGKHFQTD
jgi:hypothetical protein